VTKEEVIEIQSGGCTDKIKAYITGATTTDSELSKSVLGIGHTPNGNATYLTHQTNDAIDNLLVYKEKRIDKQPYADIVYTSLTEVSVAEAMIGRMSDIPCKGIFADNIIKDTVMYKALKNSRFRVSSEVFGMPIGALMRKCHPDSKLSSVRYRKNNMAMYQRAFMALLTEHDTYVATTLNAAYGRPIYPTKLKSSNPYRNKLHHFTKALSYSDNWYSFLLLVDDNVIGFIKGKVDKETHVCFPDLYISKQYFEKYANAAYGILLETLFRAYVRYIGTKSISHDKGSELITRMFGRALAVDMFRTGVTGQ